MKLRIYTYEKNVTKLGPGKRFVIWTQGCLKRCKGCISPHTQPLDGGNEIEVSILAEMVLESGCDGITISGGEPFLQAKGLTELIDNIRAKKDIGVIIYTGCIYEELKSEEDEYIDRLLEQCDILVDGPFIEELKDGLNLRGSSNQRALDLSGRYKEEIKEYGTKPAEVEFFIHDGKTSVVGIPSEESKRLIDILTKEGGY